MTHMDERITALVRELTGAMEEERVTFPDAVQALTGAGIERYHADFGVGTKTYYMPDGSFEITRSRILATSQQFSGDVVKQAVQAGEQGETGYRTFCDRLAAAGCVGYFVSLPGRRSVYYGRTLAAHVAWFGPPPGIVPPGPPPSRRAP
ncbi:MAG TPA: DUF1398 family protein [Bradyrhizobium sp.]|nr:DUF1398 family protein [Bradyrhizobium sp.]